MCVTVWRGAVVWRGTRASGLCVCQAVVACATSGEEHLGRAHRSARWSERWRLIFGRCKLLAQSSTHCCGGRVAPMALAQRQRTPGSAGTAPRRRGPDPTGAPLALERARPSQRAAHGSAPERGSVHDWVARRAETARISLKRKPRFRLAPRGERTPNSSRIPAEFQPNSSPSPLSPRCGAALCVGVQSLSNPR